MNGRVSRYRRIADALRERITSGGLAPGARLSNQRTLAREFGVTLMTLRQALELLEREGLIVRRHGVGTFVASPTIDYDILQFRTFAGDLRSRGAPVETRFLRSQFARADRRVQAGLRLAAGDDVFVLERLRLMDGRPVSLQRSFLPADLGDDVAKADLAVTPLRQLLSFKLGIDVTRAREEVSAVKLRRREAQELNCQPGAPAFCSERVSWATDGRAVVFDRVYIPGDRFRIIRELHYEGSGP
ncbi:MAG: GntR family transcriptional regulator [Candidatus Rokubacteria bacterium]|nr:GntR family transcriptional regulator [Candidatus Rokubacteria bacterium]